MGATDQWVSMGEVAAMLGIGLNTVRRRIADGTLPAYKIGKRVVIRRSDVERILTPIPATDG